jgi:zinc protease
VFAAGQVIAMRDDDADYPAMTLGSFITGGGFLNSRLATRIRRKDGLSYGVGARFSASPFDRSSRFMAQAIYAPQNAEKLEAAFREEIAKILEKGFTAEEVAEAKSGWLQGRKVSRAQDRDLAGALNNGDFAGRTLRWDEALESKVSELTAEAIHAAMKRHLDPAKISIVQAGDFAKAKATAGSAPRAGTGTGGAGAK